MSKPQIINLVSIDEHSTTPKYLKIAYSVVREINFLL